MVILGFQIQIWAYNMLHQLIKRQNSEERSFIETAKNPFLVHTWTNSKSFADPLDGLHQKQINK